MLNPIKLITQGYETNKLTKRKLIYKLAFKLALVLFLLIVVGGLFYWFQIRPSKIRHNCSWIEYQIYGHPAYPAMTETELKAKGYIQDWCPITSDDSDPFSAEAISSRTCQIHNAEIIAQFRSPRPAVPTKQVWRPATTKEYEFCLHDKGL